MPATTRTELLGMAMTGLAIIALLVGIAGPGLTMAMMTAKSTAAAGNARQIGLALRGYAQDNDGAYPDSRDMSNSNEAFRELFPAYTQVESNFAVSSSPVGRKADNKVEPENRVLERGENHWAYIAGLSDSSHPLWPLIVDHTDGSGFYGTSEGKPGGSIGPRSIGSASSDAGFA